MSYDSHKIFPYGLVVTAPSPATSGTSVTLQSGQGALMPTPPFNATAKPFGALPVIANAEVVRVTAVSGDTLTITRAQEGSTAMSIAVGWELAATITPKTLTDIETSTLQISSNLLDVGNAVTAFNNIKQDANNTYRGVLALNGDLGNTAGNPYVVATHLSSALPVNQGGTGTTTSTGSGSVVLSNSPTLTTPNIGAATAGGDFTLSTHNLVTDITTGSKIGTATNQKLGFFNATPIVQPTGDALTALSNLGLVSSPTLSESDVTNLVSDLAARALDSAVLHLAGAETITGLKIFNVGTFLDKGNKKFDIQAYGGVPDAKQVLDGVTTSGSPTLTSATANFTSMDTGKTVTIVGAGAVGQANTLVTTITYVNSTTVTMAANAAASLTGACVTYGTDNTTAYAAAITAVTTAGSGEIWFGRGAYMLRPEQHISNISNVGVAGENRDGTIVYLIPVGSYMRLIWIDGSDSSHIIQNPYIRNITLSGTSAFGYNFTPQSTYYGAAFAYTNYLQIWNVRFQAFQTDISNLHDTNSHYLYCVDDTGTFNGTTWLGSQDFIAIHSSTGMLAAYCKINANDTGIRVPGLRNSKILYNEFGGMGAIELSNAEGAGYAQNVEVAGNRVTNGLGLIGLVSFGDGPGADTLAIEGYQSAVDMVDVHDNVIYLVDVQSPTGISSELSGAAVNSVAGSNIHVHHNWIYGPASARTSVGIDIGINGAGGLNWHVHDNHTFNMGDQGIAVANLINSSVYDNQNVNFNRRGGTDGAGTAAGISITGSVNYPVSNLRVERNMADGKGNTSSQALYVGNPTYISGLVLKGNTDQNVTTHLGLYSSLPSDTLVAANPNVTAQNAENTNINSVSSTIATLYGSSVASGTLTLSSSSNATKGKILFGTSAYDEVNNRLGIQQTTPLYNLDVVFSGTGVAAHFSNGGSDSGGYINVGDGTSMNLTGGMASISGSWIAKATSASLASLSAGSLTIYGNTGLTVGNSFSPTQLATFTPTGITFNKNLTLSALNLITDTTTGTKIGTATNQKLAFYNSSPIVQPSGDILTALSSLGLVANPTLPETDLTNSIVTKTANYTLTATDDIVLGDTTSGSFTLTLPTAVSVSGRTYILKKIASANTLNIATTSSQTIDGSTTIAVTVQYESITVVSDGSNWQVI